MVPLGGGTDSPRPIQHGLRYEYGEGVERDKQEACRWTRAQRTRHAEATWKMAERSRRPLRF